MEEKEEQNDRGIVQMWVRPEDREKLAKISERNKRKMADQMSIILEEWEAYDARRFISER